ncbi:hypothetical protein GCM10023225_04480 [Kineococcus glutinatus]|uniref:Uncharacterized protein n=1 Tax=Kineococcus glutinatus TaxID=1070872 RepID=A0ABP9H934_9ACTN
MGSVVGNGASGVGEEGLGGNRAAGPPVGAAAARHALHRCKAMLASPAPRPSSPGADPDRAGGVHGTQHEQAAPRAGSTALHANDGGKDDA